MPREERRIAIATAALGILRTKGPGATTREIAEAAGVAEGTLFGAYASKEELVATALRQAFDPAPLIARLDGVDATLPLRERLVSAVTIVQERYLEVFELLHAMGMVHPPDHGWEDGDRRSWQEAVIERLERLVRPDADDLRVSCEEVVHLLRLLTFAGSHHILTRGELLTPDTIVDVLLDGTRRAT